MKNRRKNRKVLLLTLIAVLLMGVLSVGDNPPVQSAWNAVTGGIFSLSARIAAELKTPSTDELLDENERLRSENAALQKALAENLELKDENKTLWGYFGMKKDAPELELKPAFVLRRASADDFGGFTLGVGSDLGVKVNNAVICESGLVGRVTAADSSSCRVATLFSPDSRVAVIDGETSDSGILVGKDGGLVLTQLSESNHIKTGDMILTSGDGGVYPPRVIVGKVSELGTDTSDASSYALIARGADIDRAVRAVHSRKHAAALTRSRRRKAAFSCCGGAVTHIRRGDCRDDIRRCLRRTYRPRIGCSGLLRGHADGSLLLSVDPASHRLPPQPAVGLAALARSRRGGFFRGFCNTACFRHGGMAAVPDTCGCRCR